MTDLPELLKQVQKKAELSAVSKVTRNTPMDKLKRNLEGTYIQMKNISIFLSNQTGNP